MIDTSRCPFRIKTIYKQYVCELSCEYLGKTKGCHQVDKKKCTEMQKQKCKELGID